MTEWEHLCPASDTWRRGLQCWKCLDLPTSRHTRMARDQSERPTQHDHHHSARPEIPAQRRSSDQGGSVLRSRPRPVERQPPALQRPRTPAARGADDDISLWEGSIEVKCRKVGCRKKSSLELVAYTVSRPED